MRRIFVLIAATIIAVCTCLGLSAGVASADAPVDNAVAALQKTSVYVEPGTAGTTNDTSAYLQSFLKPGDHLVVLMINKSSMKADDVAAQILGSLPDKSTVALYVNGTADAYSNRLPQSDVNKTMDGAKAISMNSQETLATFTRLLHQYQAAHPEPVGATTSTQPEDSSTGVIVGGVGGGLLAAVIILVLIFRRKSKQNDPYALKASPALVRDQLNIIEGLMQLIDDPQVVQKLGSVVNDTEAFFRRSNQSSARDTEREAADFQRKLKDAVTMLKKYVDIQNNPRYFDHPKQLLESGAEGVDGLAAGILNAVKSCDTKSLLDYKVSSDVLSAARYR